MLSSRINQTGAFTLELVFQPRARSFRQAQNVYTGRFGDQTGIGYIICSAFSYDCSKLPTRATR